MLAGPAARRAAATERHFGSTHFRDKPEVVVYKSHAESVPEINLARDRVVEQEFA